jgi:hypothetical protein
MSVCDDRGGKELGFGAQRQFVSVKVAFARDASDDQCADLQRARPYASDRVDQNSKILVEEEEWLNRDHVAVFVLYSKIFILECFQYHIFNEFVIATVLTLIGKSALATIAAG